MSRLSPDQFRSRFPIFNRRIYVNSCSQGALSTDVDAAMQEWIRELARRRLAVGALGREGRGAAGAPSRPRLAPTPTKSPSCPSASGGINAIASALDFTGPRRQVVLGEFEFPTMAQVWLAQQRRGAAIAWARASGDLLPVEAYESRRRRADAHRAGDARLLQERPQDRHRRADAACATTAARSSSSTTTSGPGSGPIDVHALGVDFMVTGCLKYLLAAAGIGFLYVRRELIERLEPTITGWFGRVNPFAFRIDALDWPAACAPIRERHAAGAERLCGARRLSRLLDRIGYDVIGSMSSVSWSDTGRRPRTPGSSSARRRRRDRADRSSSCRVSTPRNW